MTTATHSFTKPVNTEPPLVAIITVCHRPADHPYHLDLLDSIQGQSYPHIELWAMDNVDLLHSEAALRNEAVANTTAPLCMFIAEEDMLVVDYVQSMVSMYFDALQKIGPHFVHVSSGITAMRENGTTAITNLKAPGMYARQFLLDNPFPTDGSSNLDQHQLHKLHQLAQLGGVPVTFATTHHYGYILRAHAFRRDGITLR